MSQVKKLAEDLQELKRPVDVLIYNAGEGLETIFVVNYLSSFLLNTILVPVFKKQVHGRIMYVNSEGHRFAAWGLRTDAAEEIFRVSRELFEPGEHP